MRSAILYQLEVISNAEECVRRNSLDMYTDHWRLNDIRLRAGDRQVSWYKLQYRVLISCQIYKVMHDHFDIRYKLKKIEKACDKVFVLIQVIARDQSNGHGQILPQAVLGGIPLNAPEYKTAETQPSLEALGVFRHVARIARGKILLPPKLLSKA